MRYCSVVAHLSADDRRGSMRNARRNLRRAADQQLQRAGHGAGQVSMISTLDSKKIRRYVLLCLGLLCILTAILLPTAWYDQIPKSGANLPAPPIKGVTLVRLCFGLEGFFLLF